MAQRFYLPIPQIFTDEGILAPGWKLYFYQTGTTTPLAVYSNTGLSVQLPNPVLTNNEGHLIDGSGNITNIYFSDASLYKAVLKDENDVEQWTADPCDPFSVSLATLSPRPLFYAGLTTGTNVAYNLVANPPFTSYSSTDVFELSFHVACSANPTLTYVSGGAALNLIKSNGDGTYSNLIAGDVQTSRYFASNNGTGVIIHNPEHPANLPANTTTWRGLTYLPSPITISNNVSDANNDIDFSAGNFIVSDGSGQGISTAETKRLDATWATGTNAGGLAAGLTKSSNTWYHCFKLLNPTTGLTGSGFDTNVNGTNLLADSNVIAAGLTKVKRIGSILTNGSSNIIAFIQNGNRFLWQTVVTDINVTNPGTSAVLRTLSVPLGIKVIPLMHYTHVQGSAGGDSYSIVTSPDQTDTAPSTTINTVLIGAEAEVGGSDIQVLTNTSSQIRTRNGPSTDAGTAVKINTYGWIDNNI